VLHTAGSIPYPWNDGLLFRLAENKTKRNAMKKSYESMIVVKPLSDEEISQTLEAVKNFITQNDGEIDKVDEWGSRKLAYEIEKQNDGYYIVLYFSLDASYVNPLENFYRLNENIIRFIVIKREKE